MIDAEKAHKFVANPDERYQLLHHAYVYGINQVALIVGDRNGQVISGTIITYSESLLNAYGKVVEQIKDIALYWAYSDSTEVVIPDNVLEISESISTINGKEALYGALKLWKAIFDRPSILPIPALKRIIPSTHAQWNATKGGSDTTTKVVDDCFLRPPIPWTNFESVAVGRCISNLLAFILRLYQLITAKEDLNSYPSLQHYRNAASHRMTYKKMLRMTYEKLRDEADKLEKSDEIVQAEIQGPSVTRRVRFQNQGILAAQRINFVPQKSFNTPRKKQKRQIESGHIAKAVVERTHNCTGFPVEVICPEVGKKKDSVRQRCYICKSKTRWRCLHCHFYFCMSSKKTATRESQLYFDEEKENVKSPNQKTLIYGKSYFHEAHEDAVRKQFQSNNT